MPDHHQHALDDDRRGNVQPLVHLARGEGDRPQKAGRACGHDFDVTVDIVGTPIRHEDALRRSATAALPKGFSAPAEFLGKAQSGC